MARIKLTEDLLVPHPYGREGTFRLVGRKGAMVDEKVVAAAKAGKEVQPDHHGVVTSAKPAAAPVEVEAEGYDAMKVAELRELAADRGIDADGMKKAELVEALEDADQA